MSTFVIAPDAALALIEAEDAPRRALHQLMAPAVLRSHLLEALFEQVRRGELSGPEAMARIDRLRRFGIRLLGDRVLQRTALALAQELELAAWGQVEYVALARLHADAIITRERDLAKRAGVPTRWLDALD